MTDRVYANAAHEIYENAALEIRLHSAVVRRDMHFNDETSEKVYNEPLAAANLELRLICICKVLVQQFLQFQAAHVAPDVRLPVIVCIDNHHNTFNYCHFVQNHHST